MKYREREIKRNVNPTALHKRKWGKMTKTKQNWEKEPKQQQNPAQIEPGAQVSDE